MFLPEAIMAAQASKMIDDSQRVTVARQLGVRFGDRLVDSDRRRGRGASSNPSGRLEAFQRETIDDGWTAGRGARAARRPR